MKALSDYNDGVTFLLLVIDIFSKYGWVIPLKDKKGKTVAEALKIYLRKGNLRSYGRLKEQNFITRMLKN